MGLMDLKDMPYESQAQCTYIYTLITDQWPQKKTDTNYATSLHKYLPPAPHLAPREKLQYAPPPDSILQCGMWLRLTTHSKWSSPCSRA